MMVQWKNNLFLRFLIFHFYLFSLFESSIQYDSETAAIANALDNLYITPLATSYDILIKNECSYKKTIKCILNSYLNSTCFSSIYYERISSELDSNIDKNADKFLFHLDKCSMEEIKKYITASKSSASLPVLTNLNGGITTNIFVYSKYQKCNELIRDCLNPRICIIPSQYNAFDKIIDFCSEKAFKKLNISSFIIPSTKPPTTTYIDDLNELSTKKIGLSLDFSESTYVFSLPQNIRDIFGNLTYEDLDAIKMIATINPYLKQFLCDSKAASIKHEFNFVKDYLTIESPNVPENVKKAFFTFGEKTYNAAKEVLKGHSTFRWLICSSIFALTPSSKTDSSDTLSKLGYISSSSIATDKSNNDQIASLRKCKNLVDQDDLFHSTICICKKY